MKSKCFIAQEELLVVVEHGRRIKTLRDPVLGETIMKVACYAWMAYDRVHLHPLAGHLEDSLTSSN